MSSGILSEFRARRHFISKVEKARIDARKAARKAASRLVSSERRHTRERQPPGVGNDASYAHSVTNIPRDPETPRPREVNSHGDCLIGV